MPTVENEAADNAYAGKGLDREAVVRAALDSIDRNGSQGLTMRGLALDLKVEAMSLYRYVAGREDLLEAVVTLLLEGLSDLDEQLGQTLAGLPARSRSRGAAYRRRASRGFPARCDATPGRALAEAPAAQPGAGR